MKFDFPFFERNHEDQLFKEVFGTDAGNEMVAVLAKMFHVFKIIQTPDPYVSAFQEGQRSVVIRIMEILHQDLDAVKRKHDRLKDEHEKRQQNPY